MSSTDPEMTPDPGRNLTPAEIEDLARLEAIARQGLEPYVEVGGALAEIRDRRLYRDGHGSFETYARDRWGVTFPNGDPLSQGGSPARDQPCAALARACEETLAALSRDDEMGIEIRLAVRKQSDPGASTDRLSFNQRNIADSMSDELLPTLRWLLSQATGTIGEVADRLERCTVDIDDGARAQLRDDVLVLDDELAAVKALLVEFTDWDSDFRRLLRDELPPLDADMDPDDDE